MEKKMISCSAAETAQAGEKLARTLSQGGIICLEGELGSGKTTFTQGLLKGLGARGPYTSPTFVVMKEYKVKVAGQNSRVIYHIDAYRINSSDLLNLGWEEIVAEPKNIILIEWADRVQNIIPEGALKIKFQWLDGNKRTICFS